MKSYLNICIVAFLFASCIKLSNETYRDLSIDERRALSAEYTQLAKRLESGSPKNMILLEKALRLNPKNDLAWRELAEPYLYAGLFEEWNLHMEKAIELNPVAWQAWRGYERLFYCRDYAGALFDLDATDTLTRGEVDYPQNISVDYLRGLCYFGLKDYGKSEEYFIRFIEDERIKLGEEFVDETAFLYLGLIHMERGLYRKAIEDFERGLKFEEAYADFNFHLSRIYCIMDDLVNAEKQLELARKKYLDDNYLRAYRYEAIGQIYLSDIESLAEQIRYSLAMIPGENSVSS